MWDNKEVERQLTARRLDIEELNRKLGDISTNLTNLTTTVSNSNTSQGAGAAKSGQDLDSYFSGGRVIHKLLHTFQQLVTFTLGIITGKIYPSSDSTTAVRITKADGSTNIVVIDSTNSRVGIGATPDAKFDVKDGYIRAQDGTNTAPAAGKGVEIVCTGAAGFLIAYDRTGAAYIPLTIHGSTLLFLGNMGFFGNAAVAQQVLSAYATNNQSAAYTATPIALLNAATLADLNILRVAYENLRLAYDDLRTKLQTTTLVG